MTISLIPITPKFQQASLALNFSRSTTVTYLLLDQGAFMLQSLQDPVQKLAHNIKGGCPHKGTDLFQLVHRRNCFIVTGNAINERRPPVGLYGPHTLLHLALSLSLTLSLSPLQLLPRKPLQHISPHRMYDLKMSQMQKRSTQHLQQLEFNTTDMKIQKFNPGDLFCGVDSSDGSRSLTSELKLNERKLNAQFSREVICENEMQPTMRN